MVTTNYYCPFSYDGYYYVARSIVSDSKLDAARAIAFHLNSLNVRPRVPITIYEVYATLVRISQVEFFRLNKGRVRCVVY